MMSENRTNSGKNFLIRGVLLGFGLVLIGLLAWVFTVAKPSAPTPKKGEPTPPAQAQPVQAPPAPAAGPPPPVPADPTAKLKSQLEAVLSGVREANQKKDLSLLLSYYSPNFPQLTQRAQNISRTLKIYDYPKMDYRINEVRLLSENMAMARVTWDVEAKNIRTQKAKNISKTYLIRFAREEGQWRIRSLQDAD